MRDHQLLFTSYQLPIWLRRVLIIVIVTIGAGAIFAIARPLVIAQQRWDAIRAAGVLRIGIDPGVHPYSFLDGNGWHGFDADVANEVAARLMLSVQAVPVGYDGFYDALTRNVVDVSMSAMSPDNGRMADFIYSEAYVDAGVRMVRNNTSPFGGLNDLQNTKAGAALGGEPDRVARWIERRVAGVQRRTVSDDVAALNGLRIGTFDWVLVDGSTVLGNRCEPVEPRAPAACVAIQPNPFVIAARSDGVRLVDAINATLRDMQQDGTMKRIAQKWFR